MTTINEINNKVKFSALVSVYKNDKVDYLKEAIESVLSQTVRPDEIIVAVDGPVSSSLKLLLETYASKNSFFINIFLPENIGRGAALNRVLPMCKYDYIAIVDADDINLPNRFELLLEAINKQKDLAVVGSQVEEVNANTLEHINYKKVPLSKEAIYNYTKKRSPFNQPSVIFNKNAVLEVGGYLHMHLSEDYYLWLRLVAAGYNMCNLPEILVKMRTDENLFARRGGYKYFKSNRLMQKKIHKAGMINYPTYILNITSRFLVQVLFPNKLRVLFYKKFLRTRELKY